MNRKNNFSRDSLSWAGSGAPNPGQNVGIKLPSDGLGDIYRLHAIRSKLEDGDYVDGAVDGIARFLTETLKKDKGKHGR